MNPTFKASVTPLYKAIKDRHYVRDWTAEQRRMVKAGLLRVKDIPLKYGKCPISLDEFAEWLWGKSNAGLTWECELSGNTVQLKASTMAGRLTIDHRIPLSKGGTSEFSNLVVCSEEANKIKGDLAEDRYNSLMYFLRGWPEEERQSVLIRLKGWKPIWRKRG